MKTKTTRLQARSGAPPFASQEIKAKAWARVYPAIRPPHSRNLRHGAWYPVVQDESDRVTLRLGPSTATVPKRVLEIRSDRPNRFTVIHRVGSELVNRRDSHGLGRFYAVCPICAWRFQLIGRPERRLCPKCAHEGEVAWWETV
jgi:hypothetical protein